MNFPIYLWRYCIDARGFDGLLEEGHLYQLRPLPCGLPLVEVRLAPGKLPVIACADRFSSDPEAF